MGFRDFIFSEKDGSCPEVMEAFIKQYYTKERFIPKHLLVSEPIEELVSIGQWLTHLSGKRIRVHHPMKGEKRRLTRLAVANAENLLHSVTKQDTQDLLEQARTFLMLKNAPRAIECLDISNFQGDVSVGTIVAFDDGSPKKSAYRNYRIRDVHGIDDYAMMAELLSRRLSKGNLPDLFLVDGGKGHLMAVKKVLDQHRKKSVPEVAAIAKKDEKRGDQSDKIYIPNRKNPIALRGDHPLLHLFMRMRDEAHRRAITYHRKISGKRMKASGLDHISGIGAKRKKQLLRHFGGVDAVSKASIENLSQVPGINLKLAENIFHFFRHT